MSEQPDKIKKISIIISRGSLDGVYPGLIMANGARMEGIEANLFFTFFGLYAVLKKYMGHISIATVGNPAMRVPDAKGFPLPTILGIIPGMAAFANEGQFFKNLGMMGCLLMIAVYGPGRWVLDRRTGAP